MCPVLLGTQVHVRGLKVSRGRPNGVWGEVRAVHLSLVQ